MRLIDADALIEYLKKIKSLKMALDKLVYMV